MRKRIKATALGLAVTFLAMPGILVFAPCAHASVKELGLFGHECEKEVVEESSAEGDEKGMVEAAFICKWRDKEVFTEKVVFNLKEKGRRIFMRIALSQFENADEANEFLKDYFYSANPHPKCKERGKPECMMMISVVSRAGYIHLDVDRSYLLLPDGSKEYLEEERLLLQPAGGNGRKKQGKKK